MLLFLGFDQDQVRTWRTCWTTTGSRGPDESVMDQRFMKDVVKYIQESGQTATDRVILEETWWTGKAVVGQ